MSPAQPWSIRLDVGERYPFVHEPETGGVEARFGDPDTITRWRQVMAQFEVVQDEMEAAYDAARQEVEKRREIAAAEEAVVRAQARLEQVRYDAEHPPGDDPLSWPAPGDYSCVGRRYDSQDGAWVGRVAVYDEVQRRGGQMRHDVMPYTCVEGHWHLGRTTDASA